MTIESIASVRSHFQTGDQPTSAEFKGLIDTALRDTREALRKKDAALATERAEALRRVLKEAGAVIYAQSPEAPKSGVYAEHKWPGGEPGAASGSDTAQRARVVDAEYKETK